MKRQQSLEDLKFKKRVADYEAAKQQKIDQRSSYEAGRLFAIIVFLFSLYNHWFIGIVVGFIVAAWCWENILQIDKLEKK